MTPLKETTRRGALRLFAAAVAVALVSSTALGEASAAAATDSVKKTQTDLFTALNANDNKKVEGLFDQLIDYDAFAKASLASEWAARSDSEKAQFTDLLKQIIRNAYRCNLKKTVNFTITYTGEDAGSDGTTVVKTTATKGGESVEINFHVLQKAGAWKVQDIETDTVSLVESNRSQFLKIIKKDGFPKLIDKMKDRAANATCS